MTLLTGWAAGAFESVRGLSAILIIALALELALPSRKRFPVRARIKGFGFLIALTMVSALLVNPLMSAWRALGVQPLFVIPASSWLAWTGPATAGLSAVVAIFVTDFFGYWFHRIQHATPLWRFHAVHHSIEDLHALNCWTHVTDPLVQLVLMTIPMSLFPVAVPAAPATIALLIALQPYYIHSTIRLHLGPLGYLVTDNRYHRIHHSTQPEHFNRNFGVITPLWDVLFGTAYFPQPDEWPDTGLDDYPEPRTGRDWVMAPFIRRSAPATSAQAQAEA